MVEILIKNRDLSEFLRQNQYNANINIALSELISELKGEKDDLEKNKLDLEVKGKS